MKNIG